MDLEILCHIPEKLDYHLFKELEYELMYHNESHELAKMQNDLY